MRYRKILLGLLISASCVHAASLLWVHFQAGSIDAYAFRSLDGQEYFTIAKNIAQHGAFIQDSGLSLAPDTWRTPGYPLFLALFILLLGPSPTILILIQHALAVVSVLLFFQIAQRFMSPRRAAFASILFLLEPYHLYYTFWLLSTTFFSFVLLMIWWSWQRTRETDGYWHRGALGLLFGFVVLIWPGAILMPIGILIGVALQKLPDYQLAKLSNRHLALFMVLAGCLLPPLAWMSRNQLVAGHFALSHQSGIVLAYFKATEVELWREGRTEDRYLETSLDRSRRNDPHRVWDEIDGKLCDALARGDAAQCGELHWHNLAQGNKTHVDSFEVSSALRAIGMEMLKQSPAATLACGLARIGENLVFPLGLALTRPKSVTASQAKSAAIGVCYSALAIAALAGVIRCRGNVPATFFPLVCIVALALTTAPQIDPRFRVPLIPCLAFLALLPPRRAES